MKLKRFAATFALISAATLLSAACGSSKNNLGGKTTCSPGDTRACVGPGACKGGQTCGGDGNWGACDCGASGGTGGTAGSGGAATGGGSATGGSGGVTQKDGGAGGTAGDAKSDAPVIQKDPCPPANQMVLDCSHECVTGQCSPEPGCGSGYHVDLNSFPAYVRTPDHPGTSPLCTCGDAGCTCDVSYAFSTSFSAWGAPAFRASVGPPWRVKLYIPLQTSWCGYAQASGCFIGPQQNTFTIYVMTNDPNAPARNVLIEDGTGKSCP